MRLVDRMRSELSDGSGFTLVEMLVVLVIISMAYTVAMPRYERSKGAQLQAFTHTLANHLRRARAVSIETGKTAAVSFDMNRQAYALDGDDRAYRFPGNATVSLTTARDVARGDTAARVTIFPDGSSTGAKITIESAGQIMHIGVEWLTGLVSAQVRP